MRVFFCFHFDRCLVNIVVGNCGGVVWLWYFLPVFRLIDCLSHIYSHTHTYILSHNKILCIQTVSVFSCVLCSCRINFCDYDGHALMHEIQFSSFIISSTKNIAYIDPIVCYPFDDICYSKKKTLFILLNSFTNSSAPASQIQSPRD